MRKKEPETAVPGVHADYAEVKRQDDPDKVKILTCQDKKSGEFPTVYARQKGSQDGNQVAVTKKYLDRLNYGKVVFRVDPEPSALDLQKSVIERPNTTP